MQAETFSPEVILLIVDCAMLGSLAIGVLAVKRSRPPSIPDSRTAFQVLDNFIERFVPGIPIGHTWGEAMESLKASGVEVDWTKVENSLAEYDAFRYGGEPMPARVEPEVVRLAMKLRRKILGYQNKRKGPGAS